MSANLNEIIANLGVVPGPVQRADGVLGAVRGGKTGEMLVGQAHGKYYEAAVRGRLHYSHCAARAMSAPATSAIGNIIWNPPGSGVNLVFTQYNIIYLVTDADALEVDFCYSPQTAVPGSVTVANASGPCLVGPAGTPTSAAKAYAIATITTAAIPIRALMEIGDARLTLGPRNCSGDLEGSIIIPPGYLASLHTIAAAGTAGVTSTLFWEEVPIV